MEGQESDGRVPGGRQLLGQTPVDPSAIQQISEKDGYSTSPNVVSGHSPYDFHRQGAIPQHQAPAGQSVNVPGQYVPPNIAAHASSGPFSMSGLAGALPDYQSSKNPRAPPQEFQRFQSGSASFPVYPAQQISPSFAGQPPTNGTFYNTYQQQYVTPYQSAAPAVQAFAQSQTSQQQQSGGVSPVQTPFTGQPYPSNHAQPYLYYGGNYTHMTGQQQVVQGHAGSFPAQYNRLPSVPFAPDYFPLHDGDVNTMGAKILSYNGFVPSLSSNYGFNPVGNYLRPGNMPAVSRGSSSSSKGAIPSSPRGPPRKPKQSGHALWVGNLPSGAVVGDLKDHFSREATKTIESVFLISKSNCAFINYRTETACAAAMGRFHDSRFHGVRLVCRLRRTTPAASPGVPTGPAALLPAVAQSQTAFEAIAQNREISSRAEELAQADSRDGTGPSKAVDKYFVLKSLTVEDMELSVRNSIWATQAHNEDALNKAFETAENVYLIFSVNKSGEYFGFARMASAINDEGAAILDWAPRAETVIDDPDIPRSIPTPATEFAPKGRIIDDSARGTIFWEADPEDEELAPMIDGEVEDDEDAKSAEAAEEAEDLAAPSGPEPFGKAFKIKWLSTNRLPFYRARGLRNPWNSNREVKIARDGTELETSVGRRLIQMFQRSTPSPSLSMRTSSISGRPY